MHHGQFPSDQRDETASQNELQCLVQQMSCLARQISRFSDPEGAYFPSHIDAPLLRRMMSARRARSEFFTPGLFADPAWDMLLELCLARLTQVRVSVTSLCEASNVPPTTALRWLKTLEDEGLAARRSDPFDGRRFYIELTTKGQHAMNDYFASQGMEFVV